MLMKGRLTINNSVCGRWLLSLFTMLLMSVGMQAEEYDLWVAGTQVTSDNASNVLSDGKVSWNNSSKILTLNGATINGTIVWNKDENLTIDFSGDNLVYIETNNSDELFVIKSASTGNLLIKKNDDAVTASLQLFAGWTKNSNDPDYVEPVWGNINVINGFSHVSTSGVSLLSDKRDIIYIPNEGNVEGKLTAYGTPPSYGITVAGVPVTEDNAANVLDDEMKSVSYDATNKILTLRGANFGTQEGSAIVVGEEISALTLHLIGNSLVYSYDGSPIISFANASPSLTITTSEKLPGSLSATNLSTIQPTLQNGLTYNDGTISASLANAVEAQFTGKSTYVNTENAVDNSYIYSSPEYYSSYATGENGGAFVKVSTRGQATTATMWPSSLSNAELQKKVILQLGALTATSNVTVQVIGWKRELDGDGYPTGSYIADGKTYSNAIALSTADADGIIEIPLTSTVTSENLQLVFSSSSSFSFMPISIAFSTSSPSSSGYGIQIGQVDVTEDNASNITGEGITGTISYDDANHILTLNGATITPQEEGVGISYSGTTDLTIKLIGTNAINSGNCSAIRGGQTPKLIFTKAGEQPASLQMETTESSVIDGFSAVNHEGLFKIDERILGVDNTPDTYTVLVSSTLLSGGSGTPGDPLLIKTKEDLTNFAYYICNNKISRNVSVKLYNDLNCAGLTHFAPIGYNNLAFEGTFYGNDKIISNLSIENAGLGTVGLFSYLPEGASVERLTLDNCTISGGNSSNNNIGGLVGTLSGGTISNCIIKNSSISCKNDTQSPTVGGLVGELSSGSITNSTVQACTVNAVTQDTGNSGPVAYAGGIVGNAAGGTITGCQVKGETTMLADYGTYSASVVAGAIVARKGTVTLSNNTYEYTVTASTNKYNGTSTELTTKSGYTQRAIGGQTYNEQTQQYEDNPDLFENNGAVMYTQKVTLPAESAQVTVIGEEGTYYSSGVVSDAIVLNVAPGQTATLNARPGEGYAIASLTVTTTSETITTTSTMIEAGIMQYTFTMPDAPVTVAVTTSATLGIIVAGVSVTDQNKSNVLGDGKVSFNSTTNTLTLNGATINGGIVCNIEGTLTVHLLKQNVIDGGYVSANNNGEVAFVGELQTTNLKITTDANNPGQLLLKRPYINEWNNAEYYSDYMYPSFKNGLVESENYSEKKVLIAVGPTMSPSEGLYWPTQQYTIPNGTQISCSDNAGHSVDVSVTANSFTLTETGKYNISISKAVTVDDTNFSLSNSGHYIVHNKPGFSVSAGSYDEAQTVKLTNLPTLPENSAYYPQVWYYLNNSKNDSIQYTSANQTIAVNESTRVSVYIIDEDSGKVVKSAAVTAQYTIRQDPALRFYTSENSYMSTGSTENISYDDEFTSPVLKGKINGEYTDQLTALGVTYSSSDETVATIDQTGKITIVGGGYATITATSQQTDLYSASSTNFILKIRPADPNVSLEEGAYYTGKKLTMVRIGENGTMYYSYGDKNESQRTVYPEGGISLPKGCYDFYPYTRCGTDERNIWSYGNAHRMMYVYDQPTISKDAGTYDGEIEVEITNLPESGSYNADVYYYFDDDEDHAVQYTSGSKITVNESKTLNVYIYVEGDSSKNYKTDVIERQYVIRQDAGLAYTQNNEPVEVAEYTIGGTDNVDLPELVNENEVAVTYSSEDENVATVNAETGAVTIVGIGETTIMATSAQTATLLAGEASYTLRVYRDLNYESITVTVADATYTGEAVEPTVTVMDGETDITELMIISYDNNVEVGNNATVTIVPNNDLEVNFYVGSRTETFSIVTRTLEIGSDVTFASGQKWASFYTTTENLELPENVMAYIVTGVSTETVTVKAINYVPKDVPVLIEKESTTTTDNTSAEGNLLRGTTESTAVSGIEGNVYVLYNGGFTRTTTGAIPARRAYLVLEQAVNARLSIVEGEATDITSVGYDSVATDGSTYDMQGRKVESLSKRGLYIKNGRKVVIK